MNIKKSKDEEDIDKILNEVDEYSDNEDSNNMDVEDILREDHTDYIDTDLMVSKHPSLYASKNELESGKQRDLQEHPLEVLEKQERDISIKLGSQIDLDGKFLLSKNKIVQGKTHPSLQYKILEIISKTAFHDESSAIVSRSYTENWGTPKCMAILPNKYIALGTSRSIVLVFDYGQTSVQKIGTAKEQDYGAVTAIELSHKGDYLVSGYDKGHIALWALSKKNECLKVINPPDGTPILCLKFWKEGTNEIIASTDGGIVYLLNFKYVLFQWQSEKKMLINHSEAERKKTKFEATDPNKDLPHCFYSLELLPKELVRGHILSKYTLVAMASMTMVLVVSLDPIVSIVYKYERPEKISSEVSIACISWGGGGLPDRDDNRHPILTISWGKEIFLLQFQSVEEEECKGIKFVGYYKSEYEIYQLNFLSENLLLTYDYNKDFKLLHTALFQLPPVYKEGLQADFEKAVLNTQKVDADIAWQICSKDPENRRRPVVYFTNTITGFGNIKRAFIIGYKKMYVGRLFSWREYIEEMMSKAEWLGALSLCISLFQGTNKMFAELPCSMNARKQMFQPFGAALIRDYIKSIEEVQGPPEPSSFERIWKTVVLTTIDFLVTIENFNYLFTEMKKWFEDNALYKIFLESLEPFILRNRIKYIPNEPFRELVNYYTERNQIDVLQYLIVNLTLEDMDIDFAIAVCMEYNLLSALLYLCSHKDIEPDFLTPIAKALSTYRKNIQDEPEVSYQDGLKFLWFVNMTLRGKMWPHGVIEDDVWRKKVIADIVILIFDEQHLELMLKMEPYVSFETLKILFEPKLANVIENYEANSVRLIGSIEPNPLNKGVDVNLELYDKIKAYSRCSINKLYSQMLALIDFCGHSDKDYHNLLYYFLANVSVNLGFDIPEKTKLDCARYILKYPREIPTWEIRRRKLNEKNEDSEGDFLIEERNFLILELLKKLEHYMEKDQIDEIKGMSENSDFVDVKVYLAQLFKDYKKCFDLYITQSTLFRKAKVFKWLEDRISALKDTHPEEFKSIKEVFLTKLKDLVDINTEKTRSIIHTLDKDLEIQVIRNLEPHPNLQLNYLEKILDQRKYGYKVPDELLILHIKLLAKLSPKKIYPEVYKYNYPLDECLKICRDAKILDATAFFMERAGNYSQALDLFIQLFSTSLQKKVEKIEKKEYFKDENLRLKLDKAREICKTHNIFGNFESEHMWFTLIDKVLEQYNSYIANNKSIMEALNLQDKLTNRQAAYKKLANTYSDIIRTLFDDISKHVSVEAIVKKLQEYSVLKLGEFKNSLVGMLENFYYESTILQSSRSLVVADTYESVIHYYNKISRAVRGEPQLDIDGDIVDKLVVFNCAHAFPRNYAQGTLCALCSDSEYVRLQAVLNDVKKMSKGSKGKRENLNGSTVISDPRESLLQDRGRLSLAFQHGSLYKPNQGDIQEKYLKKFQIYEEKMTESSKNWDELSNDNNFQFVI